MYVMKHPRYAAPRCLFGSYCSMKTVVSCPKCRRSIPLDDVNADTDVALCRRCVERWSYSDICEEEEEEPVAPVSAPPGAWLASSGLSFEVGATTRSTRAPFLLLFACVWLCATSGIIYGIQFANGQWSLGLSLFGIPVVSLALFPASQALMASFGKVVVTSEGDRATVFTGIGVIGRRRQFSWREVKAIRLGNRVAAQGAWLECIQVTTDKDYNIGGGVSPLRLSFMLSVLRKRLRGELP